MNSKIKAVLGVLRSVAVGIGVQAGYVAVDQTVRTVINERVKKTMNKSNPSK